MSIKHTGIHRHDQSSRRDENMRLGRLPSSSSRSVAPGKRPRAAQLKTRAAGPARPVQRQADAAAPRREDWSSAAFRPDLAAPSSGGSKLPGAVQAKMEAAFDADFSAVRIHQGSQADSIGALAYTQGTDIYFGAGQYQPNTQAGQTLIGHELAHVIQQSQGRVQATTQAKGLPVNDDAALEREADEQGARAARGEPVAAGRGLTARGIAAAARLPVQAKSRAGVIQCLGGGKDEETNHDEETKRSEEDLCKDIEAALNKLGLGNIGETTDVEFMQDLLFDIGFKGFRTIGNENINKILDRIETTPIPLASFRQDVIKGLAQNIPVTQTILRVARELDLGEQDAQLEHNVQLKYAVHMMVVLEVFTTLMIHDASFEKEFATHLLDQRGVSNKGSMVENFIKVYKDKRDMFAAIKLVSLDPAIWQSMCWREHGSNPTSEDVEKFIADHKLTGMNADFLRMGLVQDESNKNRGLSSNILEAVVTQPLQQHGGEDNARSGFAMIPFLEKYNKNITEGYAKGTPNIESEALREGVSSDGKEDDFWKQVYGHKPDGNAYPEKQGMPDTFKHTYGAWNMAFVFSQLPGLIQFVIPKLIMPHMLLAEGKDYVNTRFVSLWLTVNAIDMATRREKEHTNKLPVTFKTPPKHEEVMEIFGAENLDYAKTELLEGLDGFDPEQLDQYYDANVGSRDHDEPGIMDWATLALKLNAKMQGHDFTDDGVWTNFYASWMKENPGKTIAGLASLLATGGLALGGLMSGGLPALLALLAGGGLALGASHMMPKPEHPFGKLPDDSKPSNA